MGPLSMEVIFKCGRVTVKQASGLLGLSPSRRTGEHVLCGRKEASQLPHTFCPRQLAIKSNTSN